MPTPKLPENTSMDILYLLNFWPLGIVSNDHTYTRTRLSVENEQASSSRDQILRASEDRKKTFFLFS